MNILIYKFNIRDMISDIDQVVVMTTSHEKSRGHIEFSCKFVAINTTIYPFILFHPLFYILFFF